MKKIKFTLLFSLVLIPLIYSQKIHQPLEILLLLEESSLAYEINLLDKPIPYPDRSKNLVEHNFYRMEQDNQIKSFPYLLSNEGKLVYEKAELAFSNKNFDKAREFYQEVLVLNPNFHKALTYIGQTFGIQRNLEEAEKWYKKAIEANYIDYMAHWFLADIYKMKGEKEKAINEISIAAVLNRNNPRIQQSMDAIYRIGKLKVTNWNFNPQVQLDSLAPEQIKIFAQGDWMGYALVKALWRYEPGYKASMGVARNMFSSLEEKEAILSLMSNKKKKTLKKFPELKALDMALQEGMIDEYIVYEILLPEHPDAVLQLKKEFIEDIGKYVMKIRGKSKK